MVFFFLFYSFINLVKKCIILRIIIKEFILIVFIIIDYFNELIEYVLILNPMDNTHYNINIVYTYNYLYAIESYLLLLILYI